MFLSKKGKLTILAPVGCLQVHLAPLYTANIYSTVATMLHYYWLIDSIFSVFLLLLFFSLANTAAQWVLLPSLHLPEEEGPLLQSGVIGHSRSGGVSSSSLWLFSLI